jgi:hypothetical protein
MIHTRIYSKTDKELSKTSTQTLNIHRGVDWILEDVNNQMIKSNSYSILEQLLDSSGRMIVKMTPKPNNWIGPVYLNSEEQEIEIVKQDSKAIWIRQKGLEYVHWYGEVEAGIVEAWKRL